MLRISTEHFYGSQEKHNIELVKLQLDTTDLDEKEALDNGWLLNEGKWYQCRSVRLGVAQYTSEALPSSFSISYQENPTPVLLDIYKQYLELKGFNDIYDYFEPDVRASYLVLSDNEVPVAFTKFIKYQGGLESQLNCWNYHKPRLSIGKKMITYEVARAKELGFDFLYIGEGCEVSSAYKADLPGFQWWTGSTWSTDRQRYKELCIRDSTVKTLYDLSDIFNG